MNRRSSMQANGRGRRKQTRPQARPQARRCNLTSNLSFLPNLLHNHYANNCTPPPFDFVNGVDVVIFTTDVAQ